MSGSGCTSARLPRQQDARTRRLAPPGGLQPRVRCAPAGFLRLGSDPQPTWLQSLYQDCSGCTVRRDGEELTCCRQMTRQEASRRTYPADRRLSDPVAAATDILYLLLLPSDPAFQDRVTFMPLLQITPRALEFPSTGDRLAQGYVPAPHPASVATWVGTPGDDERCPVPAAFRALTDVLQQPLFRLRVQPSQSRLNSSPGISTPLADRPFRAQGFMNHRCCSGPVSPGLQSLALGGCLPSLAR